MEQIHAHQSKQTKNTNNEPETTTVLGPIPQ